jgi:hypothetical protein
VLRKDSNISSASNKHSAPLNLTEKALKVSISETKRRMDSERMPRSMTAEYSETSKEKDTTMRSLEPEWP